MPDAVRKIHNKVDIVLEAAEHIRTEKIPNDAQPADPDEDWMNAFIRYAEDASSERLKKLYSKILAGEIVAPGSFSTSTLRAVSELTMQTAQDFSELYARSIENWFYRGKEYDRGPEWQRLLRLQEAGFVSPSLDATHQPELSPWQVGSFPRLLIYINGYVNARFPRGGLTRIGIETGRLLARPDVEKNLRAMAAQFPRSNVEKIVLISDRGSELLYPLEHPNN